MKYLKEFVFKQLSLGRYCFSKKQVISELSLTAIQFQYQAYRLIEKKLIKKFGPHFFVIVSAEYTNLGGPPLEWVIDPLMTHLGQDYYIGLLSAASMYGATHQQPMNFQVITNKPTKAIVMDLVTVQFHFSKVCESAYILKNKVQTGYVKVSSKEQTIVDLIKYYPVCGYLSNVAQVVKDLSLECSMDAFKKLIKEERNEASLQRLGYIFEFLNLQTLAQMVEKELKRRVTQMILLRPDMNKGDSVKSTRWKLWINDVLELEE